MQIIIPMSGYGERFRRAGYEMPKPLIDIDGRAMISYVIDMFPGETDFIFICNEQHLNEARFGMEATIKKYCPTGRIVGIPQHRLGPVHAVEQVQDLIVLSEPAIVNYCDFTCYWNWSHFKNQVKETECAGAIPAYKGFHPHSLGTTNYAYLRERDGWVQDIQEKQPFTNNRIDEYASSGTYYFASAQEMIQAFSAMRQKNLTIGGEYYVSLSYKYLIKQKKSVMVYPIQHFMQWGTPEDLEEFKGWSRTFRNLITEPSVKEQPKGTLIMPMAGLGQRFIDAGYDLTKPLISVSDRPMVIQASNDMPPTERQVFVLRKDMPKIELIEEQLRLSFPNAVIEIIDKVTDGQACTALAGLDALHRLSLPCSSPLTISACDHGVIYSPEALDRLLADPEVDVIIWATRGHPNAIRFPQMFGWIDAENGKVRGISVKKPLKCPMSDPIILGTFTFNKDEDFRRAAIELLKRKGKVNGEFYIDSLLNDAIDLGLNCHIFEVDSFLCWGTPNDLRAFQYWQSCFHKWSAHPYELKKDRRVLPHSIERLESQYKRFEIER